MALVRTPPRRADGASKRGRGCKTIEPYALGGPSTVENITLRCATHNGLEAEEKFGASFMAQKRLFD